MVKQQKSQEERKRYYSRQRQCTGKVRWKDGTKAVAAFLEWIRRKPHIDPYSLTIYPCKYCEGWHIGTLMTESLQHGDFTLRENQVVNPDTYEQLALFRFTKRRNYINWRHPQF